MGFKNNHAAALLKNRQFLLFLSSQGISNLGESFRFISVTLLLFDLSGSGLSTVSGMIIATIPAIMFSLFGGSLGDSLNEKRILSVLDFIKGLISALFIISHSVAFIIIIMSILASLEAISNPSRKKIIVSIVRQEEIITANSLLAGISGASYVLGPIIAGFIADAGGINIAFMINSLTLFISSLCIASIRYSKTPDSRPGIKLSTGRIPADIDIIDSIIDGIDCCRRSKQATNMIIANTMLCACALSVNIAFYPFAFDTLRVTGRGWGIMMSIFYGTNIIATFAALFLENHVTKSVYFYIFLSFPFVSLIWFFYSSATNIFIILFLQFFEGTLLAFSGILITARLQIIPHRTYVARIISINDIICNSAKIPVIIGSYILLRHFGPGLVFLINSVILMLFSIYKFGAGYLRPQQKRNRHAL